MSLDSEDPLAPFTHLSKGPDGQAASKMVDVGEKSVTQRVAIARACVQFPEGVLTRLLQEGGPKGPILEVSRVAGILASKRTAELIPMCHPLGLDSVEIEFHPLGADRLEIRCRAALQAKTGVEMEAMVGASLAALTVYDMCKGVHKGIRVEAVELIENRGAARALGPDRTGPEPGNPGPKASPQVLGWRPLCRDGVSFARFQWIRASDLQTWPRQGFFPETSPLYPGPSQISILKVDPLDYGLRPSTPIPPTFSADPLRAPMDLKLIRNLVRLMERGELSELEIDDQKAGMRLHLKRGLAQGNHGPVVMVPPSAGAPMGSQHPAPPASEASVPALEVGERPAGVMEITSPMVGTFYRTPDPDSDPYVSKGQRVDDESVVCIIEAMKVMNEIRAECVGEIVDILVESGEPVEFGQPLFLVKRG